VPEDGALAVSSRRQALFVVVALLVAVVIAAVVLVTSTGGGGNGSGGQPTSSTLATPKPSQFSLTRSGNTLTVSAEVPDDATEQSVLAAVHDVVGTDVDVVDEVTVSEGAVAPDAEALAALAVAAGTEGDYSYQYDGDLLTLLGTATTEKARDAVTAAAAEVVPEGAVNNQIQVYDPSEAPACQTLDSELIQILKRTPIRFETRSAKLDDTARTAVQNISDLVRACPPADLRIAGYTDSLGTDNVNDPLSRDRAKAVEDALVKAGVDRGRLHSVGFGASSPVASNQTEEGRAENRRVEVSVQE
jgi:outer membrane protein OmpA-like peptidoglycan-associated protein